MHVDEMTNAARRRKDAFILRALALSFVCLSIVGCKTSGVSSGSRPVYLIKIEKGDTLAKIAAKYDTTWQEIARMNRFGSPRTLEIGQVIRVRPGVGGLLAAKHGPMTRMGAKGRSASGTSKAVAKRSSSQRSSKSGGLLFGDGEDSIRWPLKGKITSNYGRRWGRMHHGIDIAGRKGTRFGSALPGEVTFVGWKRGYGKTIIIKHDSLETLYAHCQSILVHNGDWVDGGQPIGRVGATGNARGAHLHFEIRKLGGKSVDPLRYLDRNTLISSL